jgi:hypothetical protein
MYTEQENRHQVSEETLDCPFVDLGLIQRIGGNQNYAFRIGAKSNLPAEIIVAAALEYVAASKPGQKTISISSLTYNSGSPGLAFKLSESAIIHAIGGVTGSHKGISVTDSSGMAQMSFHGDPHRLSLQILDSYYFRQ